MPGGILSRKIMKLGITVVYFVKKDDGWLIDLHLQYIRKYTPVPYKIYAGVERLLKEYRGKLEDSGDLIICDLSITKDIAGKENSFYLEQLFHLAIDDGCTHIATFHVDSFPLESGWVDSMLNKLDQGFQLAAIERLEDNDHKPHSSFMFFSSEYYRKYSPPLRLEEEEKTTDTYKKYSKQFPHIQDSGFGFGYHLYKDNLTWYPLRRSNKKQNGRIMAGVYDDIVFHLGGAGFTFHIARNDKIWYWRREAVLRLLFRFIRKSGIPTGKLETRYLPGFDHSKTKTRINNRNNAIFRKVMEKLKRDPDRFLDSLRMK
jgi:hypothetical protein